MKTYFGFAVEQHSDSWFVYPAQKTLDVVTCYDLSGFLGSWKMRDGGVFIESISGQSLCLETLNKANELANQKNGGK